MKSTALWSDRHRVGTRLFARGPVRIVVRMAHEKRIEIRWRDVDAYQHVNNAVYATYLEECRDEWVEQALGGRRRHRGTTCWHASRSTSGAS